MITVTWAAVSKLKRLIVEHPEDPIVRVTMKDLDEHRLSFSITLEDTAQPDDQVQELDGVTIAVEGRSAGRLDGITLDYHETRGFKFLHPDQPPGELLTLPKLN